MNAKDEQTRLTEDLEALARDFALETLSEWGHL